MESRTQHSEQSLRPPVVDDEARDPGYSLGRCDPFGTAFDGAELDPDAVTDSGVPDNRQRLPASPAHELLSVIPTVAGDPLAVTPTVAGDPLAVTPTVAGEQLAFDTTVADKPQE